MAGKYWLASYPKSGNTWMRAFIRNLLNDGKQPANINELNTARIAGDREWLDLVLGFDTAELSADELDRLRPSIYDWAARDGDIDYRKIHDAYTRLPDGTPLAGSKSTLGALYLIRNPLDLAASVANHYHCSIDEAIDRMAKPDFALSTSTNRLNRQVRQRLLSWSGHVLSWADAPDLRCEVVRYEDLLVNPQISFTQAATFLGLPTEPDRVRRAIGFCRFDELARQESEFGFTERPTRTTRFFRQGRSQGWQEELTTAQVERIIASHATVMQRYGYLDGAGKPVDQPPA